MASMAAIRWPNLESVVEGWRGRITQHGLHVFGSLMLEIDGLKAPLMKSPEQPSSPLVTVAMPVYNGAATLEAALDSIVNQTLRDFIFLISDNASTDRTAEICRAYAARHPRIRYVRQPFNIGAEANFRFALLEARTEFFMWAAADDTRSLDFLERNLAFLVEHPDYVGSTAPVRFFGNGFDQSRMGDASLLNDDKYERIIQFFPKKGDAGWHANGRFCALLRREPVMQWSHLHDFHFLGFDWTLITHLASKGKMQRLRDGWVELGTKGVSGTTNLMARYRKDWLDWVLPFGKLSVHTFGLMWGARFGQIVRISGALFRINVQAFIEQYRWMQKERALKASIPKNH